QVGVGHPPRSTRFPYTTLFRSARTDNDALVGLVAAVRGGVVVGVAAVVGDPVVGAGLADVDGRRDVGAVAVGDRLGHRATGHLVLGRAARFPAGTQRRRMPAAA